MGQVSLQEQFTQLNITRGLPQGAFVSRSHYLAVARGAGGRVSVDGVAYTLEPGDVLLLLGKGHEKYEITAEGKIPFDEKQIVLDCYRSLSEK